jgi:hypothetical protein
LTDVDLSEFYKLSKPKKPPCILGPIFEQLKPKERKELETALAADSNIITNGAIIEWLTRRGHGDALNPNRITSHRKRSCTCAQ